VAPESTTAVPTETAALAPCETPETMGTTTPVSIAGRSELMTVLARVETAPTTFETTPPRPPVASPALPVMMGRATDTAEETISPVLSMIEVADDPTSEISEGTTLGAMEMETEAMIEGKSPVLPMIEVGRDPMFETIDGIVPSVATDRGAERTEEIKSPVLSTIEVAEDPTAETIEGRVPSTMLLTIPVGSTEPSIERLVGKAMPVGRISLTMLLTADGRSLTSPTMLDAAAGTVATMLETAPERPVPRGRSVERTSLTMLLTTEGTTVA